MLMLISLAFALRHKHKKNEQCSFLLCLCYGYVMLTSWVFSLAYASVCAYPLVKTSLMETADVRRSAEVLAE